MPGTPEYVDEEGEIEVVVHEDGERTLWTTDQEHVAGIHLYPDSGVWIAFANGENFFYPNSSVEVVRTESTGAAEKKRKSHHRISM